MGSYMEHITTNDETAKDRLMKGLDSFLERDQDRALFGLAPRPAPPLTVPHAVRGDIPADDIWVAAH